MEEIKSFLRLRRYLASIPDIDKGGCGIAALVMHRWLKKHGKASEIVYFYDDTTGTSFTINDAIVTGREEDYDPVGCAHALIKYKGKFYDPNGVQHDSRSSHILSEDFVVRSIWNEDAWSTIFNRTHIKEIEIDLNIDLSDIYI